MAVKDEREVFFDDVAGFVGAAAVPVSAAIVSMVSPRPRAASIANCSMLFSKNANILPVPPEIVPFCEQPDVPVEMPNVCVPNEPFVVTARICGAKPRCPRKIMDPRPHPVLSTAKAEEAENAATKAAAAKNFFIREPP